MTMVKLPTRTRVTIVLALSPVGQFEILACETRNDKNGHAVALAPRHSGHRVRRWPLYVEEEGVCWALGHDTIAAKALKGAVAL